MTCPNCGKEMKPKSADKQMFFHCSNCGSSFFEQNGINRITLSSANELNSEKKEFKVSTADKKCPRDGTIMKQLDSEETIPREVALYQCAQCFGVFVNPRDLVAFKKAQRVKIQYFKLWGKPLPSVQQVLVFGLFAIVAASLVAGMLSLREQQTVQTQASEPVKSVTFNNTKNGIILYFVTTQPYSSKIIFTDKTSDVRVEQTVSKAPVTIHVLTITDKDIHAGMTYIIELTDQQGLVTRTKEQKVTFK